jgi:hypothetical protein
MWFFPSRQQLVSLAFLTLRPRDCRLLDDVADAQQPTVLADLSSPPGARPCTVQAVAVRGADLPGAGVGV